MAFRPILRASAAGCSAGHLQRSIPRLSAPSYTSVINDASRRPCLFSRSSLLRPHAAASTSQLRLYSTEKTVGETEEKTLSEELLQAESEKPEKTEKIESDSEEPWYLQEEPPRHPALVSEAPPLPTVPKGVPVIMHDLVKYVAEDMGLDELNLLDLRTLDPPAALGPSLIMLFGTARSERHLHVSAGNLKSWLRKHGIQAHADGLLGPNEFKIKMRRKQRKAKLLGTSAMPLGGDDGITTRWICMNLGTIRSDSQESIEYETDTGFGIRQTGTTIVVQMFTESKRKELDLETLWSRILARRGVENLIEDDLEYAQGDVHPSEVPLFTEGGSPKVFAIPSQRRFFSTSLRRSNQVIDQPTSDSATNHVNTSLEPRIFLETRTAELEQLQAHFAGLSPEDALEALEYSEKGRHPPFIRLWNQEIQYLPTDRAWPFRLWMCVAGRKLGVRRFDWAHLRNLVREMELLGIICHRGHYTEMLQSVYLEPSHSEVSLKEQSDLALQILNVMYERGEPIITTDVIVSLIESLARTKSQGKETGELQAVLEKFLLQADLPYMGEDAVMRLMDAYAVQDNWDRFWEIWRMPPKFMERRTEDMYTHLWTIMAETNNQRLCQDALRWCFHEMVSESPRVNPIMEVKAAIESCLRVADPDAEEFARKLFVRDGNTFRASLQEFVHLWRALNPQWPL
ncbi:ATPase synthesis protein 25, mitochondrial [Cytospora mali]|uniref:ATPase synthesis protein 25 n=1 Tax=Cytospora mali TaxID=578113 RepID=A0A194UW75_CYTMA|nr:ATPase synthesis protein 25, mitochondrial [Valsa mali var. pyri (nom. inval.)]